MERDKVELRERKMNVESETESGTEREVLRERERGNVFLLFIFSNMN